MEVDRPRLVSHPHPLIGTNRALCFAEFLPRETLKKYIERTEIVVPNTPIVVWHNGRRVPSELWQYLIPRPGDQVVIRAVVHGGGGGGGNKVVRTVATIAIVALAVYTGGAAAAAFGGVGTFTGALVGTAVSAAIGIGGQFLVNALLPLPKPNLPNLRSLEGFQRNETYALTGGQNRARQWQPMMLIFGRHKVVPDLASNPYTEYIGDDSYLNQAFHFGLQSDDVSLSTLKIGDSPISSFSGIQIQRSESDGKLNLFPGNVDTIQGFVLNEVDSWIQRTTPPDVGHIKVELASQLFFANDQGALENRNASFQVQFRAVGASSWTDVGSLTATHYWSLRVSNQQIRFGSTNFLEHTQGDQVNVGYAIATWNWVPHPVTLNQPWYGIAPDPRLPSVGITLTGNRQEPVRRSVEFSVGVGQYEVRVRKLTADIKTSRESNDSAVNQILCYQNDTATYAGQLRFALRIKATAQLQGQVSNFNAIASARAPVWNGTAFVSQQTSNPAWWFLWYAKGKIQDGRRIYGGGLPDSQIDIEAIKSWALFCDQNNLTFNYILSQESTVHDVLTTIARAGRASYSWQTGKLGVIFDQANLPVVALISPVNIKAGSFEVFYANEQTADNIIVNFINPDRDWQLDNVRVVVPNVQPTNTTASLDLEGCTNVSMAAREANLIAASQFFHRRRVTWEMDIEGIIATRGDVIQMSHDLTVWSYAGRLLSGDRTTLKLDTKVPSGGSGWLSLRSPTNEIVNVQVTSAVGNVDELTLVSLPGSFPVPDEDSNANPLDWAWQFDPLSTPGRRLKIIEVQPSGKDNVRFVAIDDDPNYYASENNPFQYTPPRDGLLLLGVVFGVDFSERIIVVAEDLIEVTAFWAASNSSGEVRVTVTINNVEQPSFITRNRKYTFTARTFDQIQIIVTPVSAGGLTGQPFTKNYSVIGLTAPMPAVTGLTSVFRDGLTVLSWNRVTDIRPILYEVRVGPSFLGGKTIAITPDSDLYAVGNGLYHVAARFATPWGLIVYGVADSILITEANLVRNVLVINDEHPDWDGVKTNTFVFENKLTLDLGGDILSAEDVLSIDDIIFFGGVVSTGTYKTDDSNIVDIGFSEPCRVDFSISEFALNFNENILAVVDILAEQDILNESNRQFYSVRPQIRYAGNDAIFNDWQEYVPGLINARYFDVRLLLETKDPLIVPFVEEFTWSIDVPDLIQKDENVTISDTGITITYEKTFHVIPNVQITVLDAIEGDRFVLTNSTESGFDVQLFNNNTPVEREINWLAQGY